MASTQREADPPFAIFDGWVFPRWYQRIPTQTFKSIPMRKLIAFTILGAVVLISAFLVTSKVNQSLRETSYRAAVATLQRDLHVGMDKVEVQKYLHSQKVQYHSVRYGGSDADTYEIKIGEDPSYCLFCEDWDVYIALEFTAIDKLREIHVRKIGTCL